MLNFYRYLAIAESFGMPTEVMSWGNTLGSAANLHLMCSTSGSSYFEMAVPYEPYEYLLPAARPQPRRVPDRTAPLLFALSIVGCGAC